MRQRLEPERTAAKQKSIWRLAGFVVAAMLGSALVFGLIGVLLIFHITPPPVIHTDPAAAQRLQQELQQAQAAAASGTQGVVRADESELNSALTEYFQTNPGKTPGGQSTVRDMRLNLNDDRLRVYMLVDFRGRNLTAEFDGRLHTFNGFLEFEPISGRIGALPIPKRSLKRAIEQMVATPETREFMRLPTNLRDLHVENGKLVVVFR